MAIEGGVDDSSGRGQHASDDRFTMTDAVAVLPQMLLVIGLCWWLINVYLVVKGTQTTGHFGYAAWQNTYFTWSATRQSVFASAGVWVVASTLVTLGGVIVVRGWLVFAKLLVVLAASTAIVAGLVAVTG